MTFSSSSYSVESSEYSDTPDLMSSRDGWAAVARTIRAFLSLDEDWDGQGSLAPSYELLTKVLPEVLKELKSKQWPAPDCAVVAPDGSVELEWSDGSMLKQIHVASKREVILREIQGGKLVSRTSLTPAT